MRTHRHNLKLNEDHRPRLHSTENDYDEQLSMLLALVESLAADSAVVKQALALAQSRAKKGAGISKPAAINKWTVWVSADLKERFHSAKNRLCPQGKTHSVFTEMMLIVRDGDLNDSRNAEETDSSLVSKNPSNTPSSVRTKITSIANSLLQNLNRKKSTANTKVKPKPQTPLYPPVDKLSKSTPKDAETVEVNLAASLISRKLAGPNEMPLARKQVDEPDLKFPEFSEQLPMDVYYQPKTCFVNGCVPSDAVKSESMVAATEVPAYSNDTNSPAFIETLSSIVAMAPPVYNGTDDFWHGNPTQWTNASSDTIHDLKLRQEYLWQWYYENEWYFNNGSSASDNAGIDDVANPAFLVKIQQKHHVVHSKMSQFSSYVDPMLLSHLDGTDLFEIVSGSGRQQLMEEQQMQNQHHRQQQQQQQQQILQQDSEPLPPYFGIMPITAWDPVGGSGSGPLNSSTYEEANEQPQTHSDGLPESTSEESVPYEMYLDNITDSSSMSIRLDVDRWSLTSQTMPGAYFGEGAEGAVPGKGFDEFFGQDLDQVLPPPAYQNPFDFEYMDE